MLSPPLGPHSILKAVHLLHIRAAVVGSCTPRAHHQSSIGGQLCASRTPSEQQWWAAVRLVHTIRAAVVGSSALRGHHQSSTLLNMFQMKQQWWQSRTSCCSMATFHGKPCNALDSQVYHGVSFEVVYSSTLSAWPWPHIMADHETHWTPSPVNCIFRGACK